MSKTLLFDVRLAQRLAADGAEAALSARRHHGEDHVVPNFEVIHLFADLGERRVVLKRGSVQGTGKEGGYRDRVSGTGEQ